MGEVHPSVRAGVEFYTHVTLAHSAYFNSIEVARDKSGSTGTNWSAWIGLHPEVDGELFRRIQTGRLGNPHEVVDPIETKGLPDYAGSKADSVGEGAVVFTRNVNRIAFTRPPTDQTRRRRDTIRRR